MKKLLLLLTLLAATTAALAQDVKYEKYTLPNGMKVILHEDHSLPRVVVNVWYAVGSKDEPARRSGFAHLFEHLMFMGTRRVAGNAFDVLMENEGGSNNASTASDRTNYYSSGPSAILPLLLWLEADRIEDLGKNIDQKKLDLQRDVVKNERREGVDNAPYGRAYDQITYLMYPESHPYHTSVIGSMEDLDNATVRDVQDFFATFYVPNNATLVVAGDFDPNTVKPLIERLFSSLPKGNDIRRKPIPSAELKEVVRHSMVDNVSAAKTIMTWHSPAFYQAGDAEMDLAGSILGDGITSRLYQSLIVEQQLATEVAAYQQSQLLGSLFAIEATAKEGVKLEDLEKAIDAEIQKFVQQGPTAEELQRQVSQIGFGFVSGLQSLMDKADKLNEYEFYYGEPNSFRRDLERYTKATPSGVRDTARRVLDLNKRLILRVTPAPPAPEQNPRDQRPTNFQSRDFSFQAPTEFRLGNGLAVQYWHRPELPMMSATLMFNGGSALDPEGLEGRAAMTTEMLLRGTGSLDSEQFSGQVELLGASLTSRTSTLASYVSLSSLTPNWDKALALMAEAVIRPSFKADELERERELTVANLEQALDDPSFLASRVANREFFGATHPYGRPTNGHIETIKKLSVQDLRSVHSQVFRASNATLFAAGSLTPDQAKAAFEKAFGNWQATERTPAPKVDVPAPANKSLRVVIVDKPDAVQTVIRFLMPSVPYSSPERLQLSALGTVLGGTFTSRLNANLREDKGYTYGAGSSFVLEPNTGWFTASSAVRADVTGAAVKEFLAEFNKIQKGDVSEDEAMKARMSIRTDVIGSAESLQALLMTAAALHQQGRKITGLGEDLTKLQGVSAADINRIAAQAVRLNQGVLVLVGDKDTILAQIKDLGLPAPVEVKP